LKRWRATALGKPGAAGAFSAIPRRPRGRRSRHTGARRAASWYAIQLGQRGPRAASSPRRWRPPRPPAPAPRPTAGASPAPFPAPGPPRPSTRPASTTAMRPQRKARRFMSTLTPLSRIAASREPRADGKGTRLVGGAHHDEVGRHVIVEQRLGHGLGVEIHVGVLARDPVDAHEGSAQLRETAPSCSSPSAPSGSGSSTRRRWCAPDSALSRLTGSVATRRVEAQVEVGAGPPRTLLEISIGPGVDPEVPRPPAPPFCESPVWSSPAHVPAVEHGRRPQDLIDRHPRRCRRSPSCAARSRRGAPGARARAASTSSGVRRFLRASAGAPTGSTVRKDGQSPRQARVVLVARRLVDLGLAPELRLDRLHAETVGLPPAVAAALADGLVDEDARLRIRLLAALCAGAAFSAAHCWSWMSAVTPGTAARTDWASRRRSRCHTSHLGGQGHALVVLPGGRW